MLSKGNDCFEYYVQLTTLEKEEGQQSIWEAIRDFQEISSQEYTNLLKDNLWIISHDNLLSVFDRIKKDMGYSIPTNWKDFYLSEFETHQQKIEEILKEEREKANERKN